MFFLVVRTLNARIKTALCRYAIFVAGYKFGLFKYCPNGLDKREDSGPTVCYLSASLYNARDQEISHFYLFVISLFIFERETAEALCFQSGAHSSECVVKSFTWCVSLTSSLDPQTVAASL